MKANWSNLLNKAAERKRKQPQYHNPCDNCYLKEYCTAPCELLIRYVREVNDDN